jgi:hypothetical protein
MKQIPLLKSIFIFAQELDGHGLISNSRSFGVSFQQLRMKMVQRQYCLLGDAEA